MCGILLQVMEEGVLTDSTGRTVSFKNAIVVMTSNIGGQLRSDGLGFQPTGRDAQTKEALRERFSPEFLGRLDAQIHFAKLESADMTAIAQKYLDQLQKRAQAHGIQLLIPAELAQRLGSRASGQGGARQLRHLVQQKVEGPLASYLLRCAKKPTKLSVRILEDKIQIQG